MAKNSPKHKLTDTVEYQIDKIKFIVQPSFKNSGNETLKSILARLIKSEVETVK